MVCASISTALVTGTQGALDISARKSARAVLNDMGVSFVTAGIASRIGPEGMTTLTQAKYFTPGLGSFGRALLGSTENTFNAQMILLADVSSGLLMGLADMILNDRA